MEVPYNSGGKASSHMKRDKGRDKRPHDKLVEGGHNGYLDQE